ncbi:MAG: DUF2269 domain-containing protein [Sphingomonadales bacterium]
MDEYQALRLVHIISSTVLFGTGLGTAFHLWLSHRGGEVPVIAAASRHTVLADWLFTTPAVILQPASGIGLILLAGHDPFASWLVASYVLYVIIGAAWIPVVVIQIRVRDMAAICLSESVPLPPAYYRYMKAWFLLGWPAFLAIIAIFALMVVKPVLW